MVLKVVLLMLLFAAIWFCLSLSEAARIAPRYPTGASSHDGYVHRRINRWWVTEPVIFSGFATFVLALAALAVAVQS